MPSFSSQPFALFVLVETSHETINKILNECTREAGGAWIFYLSTSSYDSAPKKDPKFTPEGTQAPIPEDFRSDFAGKSLEDVVKWLEQKPSDNALDPHFFAILDRGAEDDGNLVMCRLGGLKLEGTDLYTGRKPAGKVALHMGGMESGLWEDLFGSEKEATQIRY